MKKVFGLLLCSTLFLASCSGDSKSSDGEEKTQNDGEEKTQNDGEDLTDYSGMSEVSLDTFGLAMNIMLPQYDGPMNSVIPHVMEEIDEGSRWKITIGQEEKEKFCVFIEDAFGEYMEAKDAGKEIDFIANKKNELAGFDFIKVDYLVDEADVILFEKTYDNGTVDPHYHVFGIVKQGKDQVFKVYSDEGITSFNLERAKKMVSSIKSMQVGGEPEA